MHFDECGTAGDRRSEPSLPLLPPVRVRLLPHAVRASLYIGAVWIRQPKELNMKRLLGLLLVMGMVGCGGGGGGAAPPAGEAGL